MNRKFGIVGAMLFMLLMGAIAVADFSMTDPSTGKGLRYDATGDSWTFAGITLSPSGITLNGISMSNTSLNLSSIVNGAATGKTILWTGAIGSEIYLASESPNGESRQQLQFFVPNGSATGTIKGMVLGDQGQLFLLDNGNGDSGLQLNGGDSNSIMDESTVSRNTPDGKTGLRFISNSTHGSTEFLVSDFSGGSTIAATMDNATFDLDLELNAQGVSADGAGKALCIKSDGNIGTCTDAVNATGLCDCT